MCLKTEPPFFFKMTVFWDIAPCSLVEIYQRFGGAYFLHHQSDHAVSTSETSMNIYQTTRRNIREDSYLRIRRRENLKLACFVTDVSYSLS
jgi:hypothetical protein